MFVYQVRGRGGIGLTFELSETSELSELCSKDVLARRDLHRVSGLREEGELSEARS